MAVAAAVAHRVADLARGIDERAAQRLGERKVEDPVPAPRRAGLGVERADRAVGQAIRQEVQVVEDDERPELEVGVEHAAHRDGEDRVGPAVAKRGDVRAVRYLARDPEVAVAVTGDVQDIRVRETPLGHHGRTERRRDLLGRPGVEVGQRVGARPRDDPHPHRSRIVCPRPARRERSLRS